MAAERVRTDDGVIIEVAEVRGDVELRIAVEPRPGDDPVPLIEGDPVALQPREANLLADLLKRVSGDQEVEEGPVSRVEFTRDDAERLGAIAGELENLPLEIRRHFDQDGRDARFLRILQKRIRDHEVEVPERDDKPPAYEVWRSIWGDLGAMEAIADALPDCPAGGVLRGYQEHGLPEILPAAEKAVREAGGEIDPEHGEKTFHRSYQITTLLIREASGETVPPSEFKRDPSDFYAEATAAAPEVPEREGEQNG